MRPGAIAAPWSVLHGAFSFSPHTISVAVDRPAQGAPTGFPVNVGTYSPSRSMRLERGGWL